MRSYRKSGCIDTGCPCCDNLPPTSSEGKPRHKDSQDAVYRAAKKAARYEAKREIRDAVDELILDLDYPEY